MSYPKSGRIRRAISVLFTGEDCYHRLLVAILQKSESELAEANRYSDALIEAAANTSIRHERELEQGKIDRSQAVDHSRPITVQPCFRTLAK